MRKNLIHTIKEKGTVGAVEFCNAKATTLTDSITRLNNANIKRFSDKPRNSNHMANAIELKHINTFKKTGIRRKRDYSHSRKRKG
ncbi:DUF3365 domain-containing protein [uncultured Maribacter sp.]|uniref:c-type heme family protein n=1 Tax=uncultured Maribacter sp. TaxID=431308 RepID=UPI00260E2D5C|nr:DUF3365 domain-containing protein [uncultured Maribacter sp.]